MNFADLPKNHFGVVVADPPWSFKLWSKKNLLKTPEHHYDCMNLQEIQNMQVADLCKPDAACLMWATAPMLPQAVDTLEKWGFHFKSAGAWAKQSSTAKKWAFGTGYLYRSAAEFWLLGTRGKPVSMSKSIRNLIVAPVREHSRKPDLMYEMVEQQFAGPRLELFGRQQRENWTVWGDEVDKFASPLASDVGVLLPHSEVLIELPN